MIKIKVDSKLLFKIELPSSVTRLSDLLHFGQLFKACGNTYFAQIAHNLGNFCKGVKNLSFFLWNHFWANFIDIWRLFTGHTG